jgi:hypothetical protein
VNLLRARSRGPVCIPLGVARALVTGSKGLASNGVGEGEVSKAMMVVSVRAHRVVCRAGEPRTRLLGCVMGAVTLVLAFGNALALPAGVQAACGNEALRSELGSGLLPDCRAYEQITPPYKEGYPVLQLSDGFSGTGNRVFLTSLADIDGLQGSGESIVPGIYSTTRSANGWSSNPMNPPASEYVRQSFVTVEAESAVSLWEMHPPSQASSAEELYLRSPSGSFDRVGPLTTPEVAQGEPSNVGSVPLLAPVAASDEEGDVYGHVILSAEAAGRWPFDHTKDQGTSLYEYSGLNNTEPNLVAVFGPKGSQQLTGTGPGGPVGFECGAKLGSEYSESTYNAISRDGETVFFTPLLKETPTCESGSPVAPAVAEVWARRHGSPDSSSPAETVDVSERSQTECDAECKASPSSAKNFEGASENGEKVFFTSTQKLLSSAHQDTNPAESATTGPGCGGTEVGSGGCNLYEYDFGAAAGQELKLVAGDAEVLGVARISEDGSKLYFVARAALTVTPNEWEAVAQQGKPNLYVYDTDSQSVSFVATLSSEDERDWMRTDYRPVETTPNGRYLVFPSSANLTPDSHSSARQLFVFDSESGELARISKAEGEESGSAENGNGAESRFGIETEEPDYRFIGVDFKTRAPRSSISLSEAEGASILTIPFESSGKLSRLATSSERGCSSVYEYRSVGDAASGGVHLISDGRDILPYKGFTCGARLLNVSASGSDVLFETADSLLPSDTDGGQVDIYDARVGGGFPGPAPTACVFAACGGPSPSSSVGQLPTLPSANSEAEGNVPAPPVSKPPAAPTRAQLLAKALGRCRALHSNKNKRHTCEVAAHKRYGPKAKSKAKGKAKKSKSTKGKGR